MTKNKVVLNFRLKSYVKKSQLATPRSSPLLHRKNDVNNTSRAKSGSVADISPTIKKEDALLSAAELSPRPRPSSYCGNLDIDFSNVPDHSDVPADVECMNDRIPLIDIAYGITLPEKPEVFLLVSRHENHLVFYGFQFSTSEKACTVKTTLGERFKQAYDAHQKGLDKHGQGPNALSTKSTGHVNGKPPRLPYISITNNDRVRHKSGYSSSSSDSSSTSPTSKSRTKNFRFLEALQALDKHLRVDDETSSDDSSSRTE